MEYIYKVYKWRMRDTEGKREDEVHGWGTRERE